MRKAHMMLPCTFGLLILVGSCLKLGAQVGTCSGCLDAAFGTNGNGLVVTTGYSGAPGSFFLALETVNSVQKIVAAGGYLPPGSSIGFWAIARYNMDGTLDTTFNNGTPLVTKIQGDFHGLAIQSDGKILLTGAANGATVARFNTDGSVDTSFGPGGVVTIPSSRKVDVESFAIAVQPDGNILIAGTENGPTVWRFMPNGMLDPTFGSGGSTSFAFNFPYGIALQNINNQEMIVLAGGGSTTVKGKTVSEFGLTRFTPSGQLDTTFGNGGTVAATGGRFDAVAIDSSNRIVAVGQTGYPQQAVVARYEANSTPDSSFGTNGYAIFNLVANATTYASGVALQTNDEIVFAAHTSTYMAVARLSSDHGELDTSFATKGYAIPNFSQYGYTDNWGFAVLVQPDGKIVVGGSISPNTAESNTLGLARYYP